MKPYLSIAVLALVLNGCGTKEEGVPAPSPEMIKQVIVAQQKAEIAEKQRQNEERLRIEAEKQRMVAEDERAKRDYIIMGLLVLVAFALFIGIAIGSSSRKDSTKHKDENDK